jgi:hypothetical protein
MAPHSSVVIQFGGLLVALGLFGIGPAATFIDELRTLPTKKKKESDEQHQSSSSSSHLEPSTTVEPNQRRKYTQDHPELLVPASQLGTTVYSTTPRPGLPPVKPNRADNNQIHDPTSWLSFLGTPPKSSE